MKRQTSLVKALAIILLMAGAVFAQAGVIAPALEDDLNAAEGDAPVRALVVLRDQVDIKSLDQELRDANAPLAERHEIVVRTLQETAQKAQVGLLAKLETEKAAGRIKGFKAHWLVNAVLVEGIPSAVRALAHRVDVEILEADLVIDRTLTANKSAGLQPTAVPSGNLSNGLRALGVTDVWGRLGLYGTGQVVGIMDSGVDGSHSALSGSWRGNTAPANECWLDLIDSGSPTYPVDASVVGTLHTGIMVGHAGSDTVGAAPGAQWIASNAIWQPRVPKFDADIITSLEFMADPDGDPATIDDVPAVVLNAWYLDSRNYPDYNDCASRWWDAMDACEAAGPVLIFAVNDNGTGGVGTPADRASTETSSFSVGVAEDQAPHSVWRFSGRGPSSCGTQWETKPEVVAPGLRVPTTYPGNQWAFYDGTGAAAAYVAGVVALMREAAPDADAETIKQALLTSAIDVDVPGDDNNTGRGFVDAYAAVMTVAATGSAGGTVTDLSSGLPLAGATLAETGSAMVTTTGLDGSWNLALMAGSYTFKVNAPGYFGDTVTFQVDNNLDTLADITLVPRPLYQVSGTVTGPGGNPVAGTEILSMTPPVTSAFSDSTGAYAMVIPGGPGLDHHLAAWGPWLGQTNADFTLNANLSLDFALPANLVEGFETGGFQRYNWSCPDTDQWIVDESLPRSGRFSVHTPVMWTGGTSRLVLDFYASEAGQLTFHLRSDDFPEGDFLDFYMDDDIKGSWTGDLPWTSVAVDVPQGHHVFEWRYSQLTNNFNSPMVWLDDITLPPAAFEPLAVINLDVSVIDVVVNEGDSATSILNITNGGDHPLDVAIRPESVNKTAGGPDGWGYTWQDSDEVDGPVFDWVDITADGIATGLGNEEMAPEVDLGFPFLFYGELYDELNISANGFLTFTSTSVAYFNRAIPLGAEPNAFIAPFWDDLNPATGSGEVYWKSEPENGRFIVTWDNVNRDGTSTPETFQAILNVDGSMVFQYALVNNPASCSVGLENADGSDGLQVAWNDVAYLQNGLAVRFNPVPPIDWVVCDPWFARIQPGATLPVDVHFDSVNLSPGVHDAQLSIASNDRAAGTPTVSLQLNVTAVSGVADALPKVMVFTGAVPNPFNPKTELRFSLPDRAHVSLNVYDLRGRLVRNLADGWLAPGPQVVVWNGQDNHGKGASSGKYFARLEIDGVPHVKSMTLVR